jgi:phosphomannomutase/phosphoglucomutase
VTEHFQKKYPVVTLDGARIDFGEGAWAGIRYSNTSPCLSICLEARTESALQAMEKEVLEYLGTYSDVRMDS